MRSSAFVILVLLASSTFAEKSASSIDALDSLSALFDLNQVSDMTIHRLSGNLSDPPNLHGYEMIDQALIEKADQVAVLQELEYELKHTRSGVTLCFSPRHGVSFGVGKDRYDILVCYECWNLRVFKNAVEIASANISNLSSGKTIDLFERYGLGGSAAP